MSIPASTLRSFVPISQFNKGQAAQIFDRLHAEPQLVVLKNNAPAAVLLSPEEFMRLAEIEEDYSLLKLAQERLAATPSEQALSEAEAMAALGVTEDDINAAEDVMLE